jgi:hypothetical protein
MIDNGNSTAGYVGFNSVVTEVQSNTQSWTDPAPAPQSPSGATLSQGTPDLGSHFDSVPGNGTTQIIMRWNGTVPNLSYAFGAPGNSGTFDMGNIVAHFWFGTKATGTVTIAGFGGVGNATSGDTVTICFNGPTGCVGYTVQSGDLNSTVAAALVRNINNGTNAGVGPNGAVAAVYAVVDPANSARVLIIAAAPGTAGNAITMSTAVQSGSPSPIPGPGPNTTATPSGTPTCTLGAGPTTTCTSVGPFTGGVAAVTPTSFSSWSIELVGNGSAAGPGSPAATYDVRLACTATTAGAGLSASLNRFVCGPLPAYGAASNLAPTAGNPGAGTYNVPVNAVFPGAAGAFTPVNPTMYVVLNSTGSTAAATVANAYIDYIYAIQ